MRSTIRLVTDFPFNQSESPLRHRLDGVYSRSMGTAYPLGGGNTSESVVRIDDTVRKPWSRSTPSVLSFVESLRSSGIDVPEPLGRDERGRQIQEFVPGRLAIDHLPLTAAVLVEVGRLVRAIHDASEQFGPSPEAVWETAIPAPGDDLVCHNDLAPWNLIMGDRLVFIDWDSSAPSTRLWDLAYAAQSFTLSDAGIPPAQATQSLGAFVYGYGATESLRKRLPVAMGYRAKAMYDLLCTSHETGREPWATMFVSGHGDHWRAITRYVRNHQRVWARALNDAPRQ